MIWLLHTLKLLTRNPSSMYLALFIVSGLYIIICFFLAFKLRILMLWWDEAHERVLGAVDKASLVLPWAYNKNDFSFHWAPNFLLVF